MPRILILGGGTGGTLLANLLARSIGSHATIAVVSSNVQHYYQPGWHQFQRVMIVSGDRESEVRYLAEQVGITEIYAEKSPENKLAIVRKETAAAKTLYVGDGINDAPAMAPRSAWRSDKTAT